MNLAKWLIGQKKLFKSLRTYAVKWQCLAKMPSDPLKDRFNTQEQSILFDSTEGIDTAKIRAKSLIVSVKTILITTHLCSEIAVFEQSAPSGKLDRSDTQQQSMLFIPT
jgi:nucleotidyltransferase/DNA polymerase involved in DNA repair